MSKQKRKLKKNQVAIDGKLYDVTHPMYAQLYEDKIAPGEIVWDEDNQEWITTAKTAYSTAPKWNPKLSKAKNDEIYEKWQKKQDPDYIANEIRKATGNFATGLAQGAGAFGLGIGEIMNTPLAAIGEVISGRNDFKSILPNMERALSNVGVGEYKGNQQMTPGSALFPNNPIAAAILDIPADILLARGANTVFKQGSKLLNRVPKLNPNVGLDFVDEAISASKVIQEKPKTTPKQAFQSEIDWSKWNADTPNYPELINEYNAIEEATKKSGAWMKNPDGSAFQGTPEQFIQQQSSHFKKAFGNSKLVNPDGSPTIQYHGSAKKFDEFDESKFQLGDAGYSGAGIYTTPSKNTASSYATSSAKFHTGKIEPTVYELYGQANNPISSSELIKQNANTDLFNFHRKRNWKGELTPEESLMQYDVAIADQLPGVENIRAWHDAREIVFPTNKQLKSAVGNVGFFDMTNPNIFKGLVPGAIATGAIGSELMSQEESAPEQKALGGKINKKKKLPKYQTGGPVEPIEPANTTSIDFLKQMTNSPLFNERYAMMTNNPTGDISAEANDYRNFINNNLNTVKIGDYENSDKGSWEGVYHPQFSEDEKNIMNTQLQNLEKSKQKFIEDYGYTTIMDNPHLTESLLNYAKNIRSYKSKVNNPHTIFINENQDLPATELHELSHASTLGRKGLKYFNTPFTIDETNLPEEFKGIYSDKEYYERPTEVKARVDAVRKWMLENNMYDPVNERFEKKHYDELKKNLELTPLKGMNKENSLKTQIQDLMIPFKEDDVIRMFNSFVSNQNNTPITTAAYGGKITNMKKNKLPKMNWGGKLAPKLFDLAANALVNSTTYAVTDMIKAFREPEQEMRPTKMNTGMVMQTGGVVNNSPITKGASKGISKEMINKLKSKTKSISKRLDSKQNSLSFSPTDMIAVQEYFNEQEKLNDPYSPEYFEKASKVKPPARTKTPDSTLENIVEFAPLLGQIASMDDAYEALQDMYNGQNQQGTFNNVIDMLGVLPFGKAGNLFKIPKYVEKTGDVLSNYGLMKDVLQDNVVNKANGGTVYPYQERLNQSLRQPGFNPNIMGMSTGRNNVGLGFKGGPFRQMTSLTNDRKLNPTDNFTFNNNYTDPKFNLNTRLGYQDRFGFKGGVDYTSAIGENNPDTKFNVGFDKYGLTGDYNYNLNKENPNFNYGVGYKGFGFDTNFRATKEKDELYNFDAKLGYDRGNTSGNFEFTGNKDDYNLGADFKINGIGTNFKYANKKNDFKSNAPGFKNFKADVPDNNSNFNLGLLNYDRNGLSANYAISRDNQNPLIHNAKVGYSKNGLDAKLSFMGNKLDPKYNFNLNFTPEKAGPTTNANIDFKNNNLSIGTGLGYKSKKFNAGVNYKGSMDVEEETGKQSVSAGAAYKGKNFNAGIDYDRQFATEENPAVNKAGLNLGYNKNGFAVNTGVKYKTLSEADKKKDKASPIEVKAGVTYNPNYKQPKQKTTPWKLPKELMKKNEVINLIDENSPTPQEIMFNALKKQLAPINLGKRAFGGMITPDMYMQQLMYGSYAQGGQVPQNIPVEVEGGEAYELPNGEMGEFEGPSHDNGGIPVALPEQTKVYSKQLKVNGKTMADRKTKREANVAKLEKILSKNPSDKFIKEALKRQQETAALEEQQDMAMQEQANQKQQMQQQAQQGMMQEQAMAGMMQDPAMMQQMGMMMYGGKLNNGTPPYGLTNPFAPVYTAPQTGAYPQMTDANYAQMLKEKDYKHSYKYLPPSDKNLSHDMYSGYGKYPEYVYRNTYDKNAENLQWSYFNPKGKETDWVNIDSKHPAFKELGTNVSGDNYDKYYMTREYPTEYPNVEPSNGFYLFGQPLRPKNILPKTEEEKAKSQPKVVASATTTEPNPEPLFNEEQLNMLSNSISSYNPLDLRENVGVDVKRGAPGVSPYDAMGNVLGNTFENIALSKDPYISTKNGMIPNPFYNEVIGNKMLPEEKGKKPNKFMNFLNEAADKTGDFFSGLFDKNGKPKKEKGTKKDEKGLPLTAGDRMGMAGTLFGGLAPMTTTMLNRMMTPKNQNFFREYGAEGLRAMQEAQALSGINRDKQLADIKLGEEASRQRGRNSARGVNTLRAMDVAADITANQSQNQAYNMYAQQMMQLLGQKAQMENQQDQAVMQGEYTRDLADRQDVDQFYTNLAENFASQSELMQKQGRDMNQAQYNKMILQMSPMFSKYGIGMDVRNGQYVLTYNGEDIDQTKARLIVEKGIEAEKKAALEKEKAAGTTTGTVTPNTTITPNAPVAPVNPIAPTIDSPLTKIYKKQFKRG